MKIFMINFNFKNQAQKKKLVNITFLMFLKFPKKIQLFQFNFCQQDFQI